MKQSENTSDLLAKYVRTSLPDLYQRNVAGEYVTCNDMVDLVYKERLEAYKAGLVEKIQKLKEVTPADNEIEEIQNHAYNLGLHQALNLINSTKAEK